MKSSLLLLGALALRLHAQSIALSGTVVDGEERDGLKNVEVALVHAGISTTTDKKGNWSLASGTSIHPRSPLATVDHGLRVVDGRIQVRIGGRDALGRRGIEPAGIAPGMAARSMESFADTLVYAKDGFVTRRTPVPAPALTGIVDSLYRIRGPEWEISSHANVKSDTLHAFADTLRVFTFKFAESNWKRMMKTMADSCGKFGIGLGANGGRDNPYATKCQESSIDFIEDEALVWVPVTMLADGRTWNKVGLRLKGNASLMKAWSLAKISLPFRINTDKFEDDDSLIRNQRFWGFQKLSFFNYDQDSSGIRGAVASEIFREGGAACPISRPVQIQLDTGNGNVFAAGVYEMLEVPDNPFLKRNFANDSGNLYKPLSKLDKWVESEWSSYDVVDSVPTFADAKKLIEVVNAANRTADSAAWHRDLEAILNVKGFLNWLALSTAMFNWDAYGSAAHNYYLFDNRGVFEYVPYDFGWAFDYSIAGSGMFGISRTSIWYNGATGGWGGSTSSYPMVKNLLADKSYCELYRTYMLQAIAGPASAASFQAKVDKYGPPITKAQPSAAKHIQTLRDFMTGRIPEIQTSLGNTTCPVK